ncbi:hypothetical protein BLNAU_16553 [Blattamonas nauphoetae]|uniref:Uncharacterized protein n=1 Tax=Blattamonas nauphoetae TaxID=2049346 RepID=A0ABQ9X9V5_9EUKA|nr:hypothetical protein BLNAU_16553 [Blattamonas nauphoetae]
MPDSLAFGEVYEITRLEDWNKQTIQIPETTIATPPKPSKLSFCVCGTDLRTGVDRSGADPESCFGIQSAWRTATSLGIMGSFSLISEPILHYVPSEKSTPAPIDSLDGRWSLIQHCENDQERRRCEGNKREGDEDQQFEVDEDIEGEYEQAEKEDEGTRSMGENEEVEENEHEQTGEMEKVEENDNAEDKQEEAVEDEVNKTMEMPMTTYKNLSNQNAKTEMLRNSMKKYAKIPDLNRMHMGKKTMMMKLSKTNISTMKFMTRPEEDDVNAEEVEYFEEDQVEDEEIEAEVKTRSFGALT